MTGPQASENNNKMPYTHHHHHAAVINGPILGNNHHSAKKRQLQGNEYQDQFERLRHRAVVISLISLFFNLILAVAAFVCSLLRNSASTSAFALDCTLDAVSSLIVFWRYWPRQQSANWYSRETTACIYLGILFVVSGISVTGKAIADIISQSLPSSIDLMLALASCSLVICLCLFVAKFWLWTRIRSNSMLLDAINTLISVLFCAMIVGASILIEKYISLWYLDPLASILLAITMAAYGIKCIWDNLSAGSSNDPRSGYMPLP